MRIVFTGHRDRLATQAELERIAQDHPGAVWCHGGAIGFDQQVATFADRHQITQVISRPNYSRFGRGAPLIRNRTMLETADLLVACFDGRSRGGTHYTLGEARRRNIPTITLTAAQAT